VAVTFIPPVEEIESTTHRRTS